MNKNNFIRIKFKNGYLTQKKFWKIVTPENEKWYHPSIFCEKKGKLESAYKGQIKNKKAHGKGVEILFSPFNKLIMTRVEEYYSGNWKSGKRHGKGIWYNYHPKIGQTGDDIWPTDGSFLYSVFDEEDEGHHSYEGEWENGKRHGKGESVDFDGIFKGEFKDDKKWNGVLTIGVDKKIIKKGKFFKKIVLSEREKILALAKAGEKINLKDQSKSIRNDKKIVTEILLNGKYNNINLKYVDKKFQKDKNIALAAVKKSFPNFIYVNKKFLNDRDVVLTAFKNKTWFSPKLRAQKVLLRVFKSLNKKFQNDKEIVNEIFKSNIYDKKLKKEFFLILNKRFQNDDKFIFTALRSNGYNKFAIDIFKKLSKAKQQNKKIVFYALECNGGIYKYLSKKLKNDKKIMLAAGSFYVLGKTFVGKDEFKNYLEKKK